MGKKKIGRNDPCPCGSGKKYKHCCGKIEQPPVDLFWKRVGESLQKTSDQLFKFALKRGGNVAYSLAVDEFFLWPEDVDILEELIEEHNPIFVPWFMNNWYFDPDDLEGDEEDTAINLPPFLTFAEIFLKEKKKRLDSLQQRILKAEIKRPYSFHEVLECTPGEGFMLRDLFLEETRFVSEKMGSEHIKPGNILFARTLEIDELTILDGCGTVVIPPIYKSEIFDLRDRMRKAYTPLTADALNEYDVEIRDLYFYIYDSLFETPEVRNYDGEEICYTTLYFEIDDPEEAFEKLHHLSKNLTREDMLEEAVYDEEGRLTQVEVQWDRKKKKGEAGFAYVLLGTLEINKNEMIVQTNSLERAKKIEKEIGKCLKGHARLLKKEMQHLEEGMAPESDKDGNLTDDRQAALMKDPGVRASLEKFFEDHWKEWLDSEIPALHDKTPRETAKTAEGRELLRALLQQAAEYAKKDKDEKMSQFQLDLIEQVRKELGLDGL